MTTPTVAATGAWTAADDLPTPAAWYGQHDGAVLLDDDSVLVTGGADAASAALDRTAVYDPTADAWQPVDTLGTPRQLHTITRLADGKVLVVGGLTGSSAAGTGLRSAELYDPNTHAWTTTGSLTTPRWGHSAALLPDGSVLVAGGSTVRSGRTTTALRSAERYDPSSGRWSPAKDMTDARTGHTAVPLEGALCWWSAVSLRWAPPTTPRSPSASCTTRRTGGRRPAASSGPATGTRPPGSPTARCWSPAAPRRDRPAPVPTIRSVNAARSGTTWPPVSGRPSQKCRPGGPSTGRCASAPDRYWWPAGRERPGRSRIPQHGAPHHRPERHRRVGSHRGPGGRPVGVRRRRPVRRPSTGHRRGGPLRAGRRRPGRHRTDRGHRGVHHRRRDHPRRRE